MLIVGLVIIETMFTHRRTDYENVAKMEENCGDLNENGPICSCLNAWIPVYGVLWEVLGNDVIGGDHMLVSAAQNWNNHTKLCYLNNCLSH